MELPAMKQEKIKLAEINQYLTCYLCKGYLIDATTISECLHSFCRSCIIKFLQDNSYCPVCELIINKAKPNLKLDKTLQDIVYKLVPELFLKEMLRRKTFYKDYPQIAARVSPEERGEDTERTIFNPQEMISLSLEYICDDSTPGAIRIPGIASDPETLKNNGGSVEESQESQMKRYLLCPGMCRIEVLKKFVRNKYNVDTSQFFIDLLYKRVPLPDHYTLIDIAYIYSWQRNELMKFFFRIIDRNKNKRPESPENNAPKYLPRNMRRTKSKDEKLIVTPKRKDSASDRKSHRKSIRKISSASKYSSPIKMKKEVKVCDRESTNIKSGNDDNNDRIGENSEPALVGNNTKADQLGKHLEKTMKSKPCKELSINNTEISETEQGPKGERCKNGLDKEKTSETGRDSLKVKVYKTDNDSAVASDKLDKENLKEGKVPKDQIGDLHKDKVVTTKSEKKVCETTDNSNNMVQIQPPGDRIIKSEQFKTEIKKELPNVPFIKKEPSYHETQSEQTEGRLILKVSKDLLGEPNIITTTAQNFTKPITKSYTSITLNRSENVEIITKIEPVSNKDGRPIGHHIIKQTIKKGQKLKSNSPKKASGKLGQVTIPRLLISKKTVKKRASPKRTVKTITSESQPSDNIVEAVHASIVVKSESQQDDHNNLPVNSVTDVEDEKSKFLKCVELTPTSSLPVKAETSPPSIQVSQPPKKQLIISRPIGGQKRKSTSPLKNNKAKVLKLEPKKPVKIILHEKPNPPKTNMGISNTQADIKCDNGLQSLINSCKIPSSLSITIKDSSDKDSLPPIAPPVKNFIEILKLPDESSNSSDKEKLQDFDNTPKELTQLEISKFCDNDSEQKVDQDLSEIAKSLTEKIPMSTTISQIVGPKQQFQIPVKTNIPQQFQIQPAPVPELNNAVTGNETLGKLNPRSPQTFQKIFEESLKKPPEGPKTSAVEVIADDPNAPPSSNKRNILEIASQLSKKTKVEQDQDQPETKKEEVSLPKVPIPRLPNPRTAKSVLKKFEPDQINKLVPQTVATLHSSSLGMNYTVSVSQPSPSKTTKANGIVSPVKAESVPKVPECKSSVSLLNELKSITTDFKVPSPSLGSPKLPEVSSASASLSPKPKNPSPKHSPKSSPLIKHMYAPTVPVFNQKVLSPMNRFASLSPKQSRPSSTSPRLPTLSPKPPNIAPKPSNPTPSIKTPQISPSSSTPNGNSLSLSPNEILEKYNIQNLAQLSASINFNPSVVANNQLAAFQHAMLLKHFEMQNRHNWLNRNQGPLLQYEKYLQSLNGGLNGSQSNL